MQSNKCSNIAVYVLFCPYNAIKKIKFVGIYVVKLVVNESPFYTPTLPRRDSP